MTIEIKYTCPLGSTCEEVKDGKIHRCRWFVKMAGRDASGEEHNRWDCSMAWMPILQVEMSGTNRGQTEAIESLRNEQVTGHNEFMNVITQSVNRKSLKDV